MFLNIVVILFIISFLLALKSLKGLNEKPKVTDVKKGLDKHKLIVKSHSSSR